jgi:hypothetical protein
MDDVTTETFSAHVEAVKAAGVPVRTVSQMRGCRRLSPGPG